MAAAILAAPRPAAAHALTCNEIWNPHGQTTPPAGNTTCPGSKGGQNEDGFYQIIACNPFDSLNCPSGFGAPIFGGLCTCGTDEQEGTAGAVLLRDGCPGETGGGTGLYFDFNPATPCNQTTGAGCDPFPADELIIKYTEANGKTPGFEPMAGNNSPNGGGQAISVDWHLWGQGDLYACAAADPSACVCCHVPPLPKDTSPPQPDTSCPPLSK